MTPDRCIELLAENNSRLYKEELLEKIIDNKEFVEGVQYALDPLITFGVKDVDYKTEFHKSGAGLAWNDFKELLEKLRTRQLTGHAAKDAIEQAMLESQFDQWNWWYRSILVKDLKCGVSEKTINKVRKGTVPVFGCMLAHDGAKHEKKIVGDCFIEYKYDGVRVIAIVQNDVATLYSRNGKQLNNFPHIEAALSKHKFNGCVFDGEVMSENFQALMKQVHRKEGAQTQDAYLAVFDLISIDEFNAGVSKDVAAVRRHKLEAFTELFDDCIRVVDATRVDLDTEEGRTKFAQMNKRALEEGYEGLMIKPAEALYHCKRSHAWLKIKPFIEVTLKVVGLEEGTGRNVGKLGALIVEGEDDGKFFKLNVGSGLTDEDREVFWESKNKVVGQLVEIRADAATQSQDSDDVWSLRFPRFKTFRGFDLGEKL